MGRLAVGLRKPKCDGEAGFGIIATEEFDQCGGLAAAGEDLPGGGNADDADDEVDGHGLGLDFLEVGCWWDVFEVGEVARKGRW